MVDVQHPTSRRMRVRTASLIAMALSSTVAAHAAAQAPVVRLGNPTGSSPEPFTAIESAVELGGGQLLVSDTRERRLTIIDFATGRVRNIGRVGGGPGEFRLVGKLMRRPGGGAWVSDFGLRRVLPVNSDGTFDNPVAFPVSIQMRATDNAGNIYGEAFLGRGRMTESDSMWILRWNPAGTSVDTLMKYNASMSASIVHPGEKYQVWVPLDAWDVMPDGDVLVLTAKTYGIERYRAGRLTSTASVAWTPVRVTPQDQAEYRRRAEAQVARSLSQGAPSGLRPTLPPMEFPETMPPFGGEGLGGSYTSVSPDGETWVERLRAMSDSVPRYDVLDASGTLVRQVILPPRGRVLALGRDAVYVMVPDEDDVQFVRRYAIPRGR